MKRALVVDDSPICRELLREILEADGDIAVVGHASSGTEALSAAARLRPDIITLDIRMPKMDGLEVLTRLMASDPCPVLVVTDLPTGPDANIVFEAIRRGALDVARKPEQKDQLAAKRLRELVRLLSTVPVVRHPGSSDAPHADLRLSRGVLRGDLRVVAIGASAGGPAAIAGLVRKIDRDFAATVAIVQHLPAGFSESFARYLAERSPLEVRVAHGPVRVGERGIVLPPDDRHLVCAGAHLVPSNAPPEHGLRPSVDMLFRTLAVNHGRVAAGVVLSGIGRDGAQGLLELRRAGALTIAQDETTSAVWGMPRAAVASGGAEHVLALDQIAPILQRASQTRPKT